MPVDVWMAYARRANEIRDALRAYHELMPGLAECANECGAALLYSDAHQANARAEAALRDTESP
jgi:hypothetical protein